MPSVPNRRGSKNSICVAKCFFEIATDNILIMDLRFNIRNMTDLFIKNKTGDLTRLFDFYLPNLFEYS